MVRIDTDPNTRPEISAKQPITPEQKLELIQELLAMHGLKLLVRDTKENITWITFAKISE